MDVPDRVMPMAIEIYLKDFSVYPAGRDEKDDPDYNGKAFRNTILMPAITRAKETNQHVNVHFDGVMSLGSSFLEESFGGLVRMDPKSKNWFMKNIKFPYSSSAYRYYAKLAEKYIRNA